MKKTFLLRGMIAILLVFVLALAAVSCTKPEGDGDGAGNTAVEADKTALNAEIALEIAEQGDYTADSYNAYAAKLAEAKTVANDAAATQEAVDKAAADLTAARLALTVRSVEEVSGANKEFKIISGKNKEIVIADYVNVNGLSKITYKVQSSNEIATVSTVSNGKFVITAGDVAGEAIAKISINVYFGIAEVFSVTCC